MQLGQQGRSGRAGQVADHLDVEIILPRYVLERAGLDALQVKAQRADGIHDLCQLPDLVVDGKQKAKSIAVFGHRFSDDDKSGGVVVLGVDVRSQHGQTVELGGRQRGDRTAGGVAQFLDVFCRKRSRDIRLLTDALVVEVFPALHQPLRMRVDGLDVRSGGAGQTQQVLADLQIIHAADVQLVRAQQVQYVAHVARVAVLKGDHAVGDAAVLHRVEDLLKRVEGDRALAGEQVLGRRVGMAALRAEIAHHRRVDQRGLIVLGQRHVVADEVLVVGKIAQILHIGAVPADDGLLARRVEDGQMALSLVVRDGFHGLHALAEQLRHLLVHLIDDQARLLQLRHIPSPPCEDLLLLRAE